MDALTPSSDLSGEPARVGKPDFAKRIDVVKSRPVLSVRRVDASHFRFSLRSKVNTRLLSGGPLPWNGDLRAQALAMAKFCKTEECLRIAPHSRGFAVLLITADGSLLGRSTTLQSEALAVATRSLIIVQAMTARIVIN